MLVDGESILAFCVPCWPCKMSMWELQPIRDMCKSSCSHYTYYTALGIANIRERERDVVLLQLKGIHASSMFSYGVQLSFSPAAFAFLHTTIQASHC